MKYSQQVGAAPKDAETGETQALLKLLELSQNDIEAGNLTPFSQVVENLRKSKEISVNA